MTAEARVLVVDDEPDLLDLVQLDLELSGYSVAVARDGFQALERLRHEPPDVVLLDVMMPRMDGWQVLARMRSDEDLAGIPVVLLTALSGEIDRIRGQLSGAVRYLTKPFELSALVATVREVLDADDVASREEQRATVTAMLQRLAELEAGRERSNDVVRLSRLEPTPSGATRKDRAASPAALSALTRRQREVAALLAAGVGVRDIATRLGTSRANIYATRQRIARVLGVSPRDVAEVARASGLMARTSTEEDGDPTAP